MKKIFLLFIVAISVHNTSIAEDGYDLWLRYTRITDNTLLNKYTKQIRLSEAPRKGGYGIYYHFDYVGGPRNYKWLNTNPIPRVWEQMHMAWEYKSRQIWIVNVGDIKPMEFPISFFLDYAWNPERIGADDLQKYTEQWAAAQFGEKYAKEIADIISKYSKYNGRRKPELLDANTYSLNNYYEADLVSREYSALLVNAERIYNNLSPEYRDAYFQLVMHPVKAGFNLYQLYYMVALNQDGYKKNYTMTNAYADKAKEHFITDSLITLEYHRLNNGKWNHMMSQTHIGYTYWQQPPYQKMPDVKYLPKDSGIDRPLIDFKDPVTATVPANKKGNIFFEKEGYVSIEADHFTKAINTNSITWKVLPDHGRTGSAVTPFPVTAGEQKPGGNAPHLQYEFYTSGKDSLKLLAYFSPSLNFFNTAEGLQYAVSIDDEMPQIISINSEDKNTGRGIWSQWVADNIIIKTSRHKITKPGKHTVKYWMVNPGVVLQKIVLDLGGVKPSYLGPPETKAK